MNEGLPSNKDSEELSEVNKIEPEQPSSSYRKIRNTLGKAATVGAAFLLTSASELNPPQESLDQARERAKRELLEDGITSEQKKTYKWVINDLIYRGIIPRGTDNAYSHFKEGRGSQMWERVTGAIAEQVLKGRPQLVPAREDVWRLYLGLPQANNTFGISDHSPSRSKEGKYYYKINDAKTILFGESDPNKIKQKIKNIVEMEVKEDGKSVNAFTYQASPIGGLVSGSLKEGLNVMGQFRIGKGVDQRGHYISYYDRWDLDIPLEKGNGFFGSPVEIYDRIYFNPQTFEIID